MNNILPMVFFFGVVLLYIDLKIGNDDDTKKKEDDKKEEMHRRITEMYSGSADVYRPMFDTKIDDLWTSSR